MNTNESSSVGYRLCNLCHFGIDGVLEAYQASDAFRDIYDRWSRVIRDTVLLVIRFTDLTLVDSIGFGYSLFSCLAKTLMVNVFTIAIPKFGVVTLSLIARDFIEYA